MDRLFRRRALQTLRGRRPPRRCARVDLWRVVGVTLLTYVVALMFDVYDRFLLWTREVEDWEIDELFIALAALALSGIWYTRRRLQELRHETAQRQQMEAALALRVHQMEAVRAVVAELTRVHTLAELLDIIVLQAVQLTGAQCGALYLWDTAKQRLVPHVLHGYGSWLEALQPALGEGLIGLVAAQCCGQRVDDYVHSPHAHPLVLQHMSLKAVVAEPLLYEERLLGVIALSTIEDDRIFTAEDSTLLALLADEVTIAIVRQQIYDALQESAKRYRDLFENASDIVYTHDLTGRFTSINRAGEQLTGYTREEVLQMHVSQLVAPESLALTQQQTAAKLAGATQTMYEIEICTKTAQRLSLEVSSHLLYHNDQPVEVEGIARDITMRKRHEEQLLQMHKMEAIGTLAGGIAHDFNNILAAIMAYADLSLLDLALDSDVQKNLEEILQACERAKELVAHILTFSRQEDIERHPIVLSLIIREALKLVRASLPSTIIIEQNLNTAAHFVLANATQMHQVLLNLCANAEHAMRPAGGTLEVSLEPVDVEAAFAQAHPPLHAGAYMRLMVRDTGHGIEPAILARLYEPFFTTKAPGEGTGLGLAVVHGIVTTHGGGIVVESAPGQGTTFSMYIPRLPSGAMGSPVVPIPPASLETARLLLVDDEVALLNVGQKSLTQLGYRVDAYSSSVAALQTFRARPDDFDLVITDQTMPGLTGDALVGELRSLRPALPIILCTGFSHMLSQERVAALGLQGYLMKPLRTHELVQAINTALYSDGKAFCENRA